MIRKEFNIRTKVWLYQGQAAWHFATVPKKESDEIKKNFGRKARGWGSLRVVATIGKTSWKTSIFPDKRAGAYLLPLKAEVRRKENILDGDIVRIKLALV